MDRKELVESLRLTEEEIIDAETDGETDDPDCPHTWKCFENIAKAQLQKVLNCPDLFILKEKVEDK